MAKMHWLSSTGRDVHFAPITLTMCGKAVAEKAATRDHHRVNCVDCVSAMEDWTTERWQEMQAEICAQEAEKSRRNELRQARKEVAS